MQNRSMKANALLNGIRTLAAIVFPLITYPYISRVLGADNLGKINFANSIVNYFLLLAALGISSYAVREGGACRESKEKITEFSNQVFTINFCFTILSYLLLGIVLIFSKNLQNYRELIIIQSFIIISTTLGVEWLFSIFEDYVYITVRTIFIQIISLILMLLLVRNENDYLLYAIISVLATGGGYIVNFIYSHKFFPIHLTRKVEWRRHMKPMFVLFFNTLAITIYVNSDITILGFLKGDYYVGIYSTSVKIYTILKQVVNALLVSSLPRLSFYVASKKEYEYQKLLNQILRALLLVLFPMIVGVIMMSRDIVVLVSGKMFEKSSGSLQLLSIAIGFSLLAAFFSNGILLPHRKDKKILMATIISAVVNLGLNFVLIPILSEKGAAITTVIAEFLVMMIGFHYSHPFFIVEEIRKTFFEGLIGILGIIIICLGVNTVIGNLFLRLFVAIIGSGVYYIGVLLGFKESLLVDTMAGLARKIRNK